MLHFFRKIRRDYLVNVNFRYKYISLIPFLFFTMLSLDAQELATEDLRCEYKLNPLGIDIAKPRLSWKIAADTATNKILQKAYRIQVSFNDSSFASANKLSLDTKKVNSERSVHLEYTGEKLVGRSRYYWRVKVWDNHGRESDWSKTAYWETGINESKQWKAQWIIPDLDEKDTFDNPAPYLRRDFEVQRPVKKARLYITSKGLYLSSINGFPVSHDIFTPGWTSYNKRLQYQVYDVTSLLNPGTNTAGVILSDGWFKGRLFAFGESKRNLYGDNLSLIYQLEIEYDNGEMETIVSDENWKSHESPIRMSSIYDGEVYDANFELKGWDKPGYNDKDWMNVRKGKDSLENIVSTVGVPVRRIEEIKAKEKIITPKDELVFDFGQNLVGRLKLNVKGSKGDTLRILHAEVLDQDGNFYTTNLRSAKQKIEYIFKDDKEINYEPYFTFQGFRYVKVSSFTGTIELNDLSAVVIHSDMEPSGTFECSDTLINQLQSNIRWGQKGNFLDVPTDCPQRDERLGWTGDAQAFASTAMFNFNTAAFYSKWLKDLILDQFENGSVPWVVPDVLSVGGSTGWGDAATILPYTMYLKYGDKRILEEQYESMKKWVDFLHDLAGDDLIINDGFHFGDWLFFIHPTNWNDKPGYTDTDLIATAFFAYSSKLVAKTAEILGKDSDVEKYNELFGLVKASFMNEFLAPSGRLSSNSQTAYVLALNFELIPEELIDNALEYLVKNIKGREDHLSTGFLGTPYLAHVLTKHGKTGVAYDLLLQKTYPSWLYPVTKGATTIWERWDGIKPDGSFQNINMNSFNHYAYGAIGDWMYSTMAGIQFDETQPGYKHIIIKPEPDSEINYAKATYQSMYGTIVSDWKIENEMFQLTVVIPPNSTATIHLPFSYKTVKVGSGKYNYQYKITD